jgi:hypothetical protein
MNIDRLEIEITEMLGRGTHPSTIAAVLSIPVAWIYEILDREEEAYSPFITMNS